MVYQSRSKKYKSVTRQKHTTTESSTRIHVLLRKNGDWGDTTILLTSGGGFHKWGKGNIVIHGVPKGQNEKLAIYRSVHSERKKKKKKREKRTDQRTYASQIPVTSCPFLLVRASHT